MESSKSITLNSPVILKIDVLRNINKHASKNGPSLKTIKALSSALSLAREMCHLHIR